MRLTLYTPSLLKLLLLLFLNEFLLQQRTRGDSSSAELGATPQCQIWASESERWKHHSISAEKRGSRSKSCRPRCVSTNEWKRWLTCLIQDYKTEAVKKKKFPLEHANVIRKSLDVFFLKGLTVHTEHHLQGLRGKKAKEGSNHASRRWNKHLPHVFFSNQKSKFILKAVSQIMNIQRQLFFSQQQTVLWRILEQDTNYEQAPEMLTLHCDPWWNMWITLVHHIHVHVST